MNNSEPIDRQVSPTPTNESDRTVQDDDEGKSSFDGCLPSLIVGPSGSGKTFQLALLTAMALNEGLPRAGKEALEDVSGAKALCLAPTNTSAVALRAMMETVLSNDRIPNDDTQPQFFRCDTFHHAARRWLASYGHLIGRPSMSEVCSERRVESLLESFGDLSPLQTYQPGRQSQVDTNVGDDVQVAEIQRLRDTIKNTLSIELPGDEFVQGAMACAKTCKVLNVTTYSLRRFIRAYKHAGKNISMDLFELYGEETAKLRALNEMADFYDEILLFNRLYDFDDLIVFGALLAERHAPEILAAENAKVVVVDDLQNTNEAQRRLLHALVGKDGRHGRLVAACDSTLLAPCAEIVHASDSSVFAFAGADTNAMPDDLMQQVLGLDCAYNIFELRENHRSSFAVQQLAYGVLDARLGWHNAVVDRRSQGVLRRFDCLVDEAQYISDEIQRLQELYLQETAKLPSIAIAVRTNEHVRFLSDQFIDMDVALRIVGQQDVSLCSPEAMDLLSFLCAAHDPALHRSVQRALLVFEIANDSLNLAIAEFPNADTIDAYIRAEIEDALSQGVRSAFTASQLEFVDTLREMFRMEKDNQGMAIILDWLSRRLNYRAKHLQRPRIQHSAVQGGNNNDEQVLNLDLDYAGSRWENVQALLRRAQDFDSRCACEGRKPTMDRFLRLCHAYAPRELEYRNVRPDNEITLCTMHYTLGAEYDAIFISGVERGSKPLGSPSRSEWATERKLLHLTILRARRHVYLTYCNDVGISANEDDDDNGNGKDDYFTYVERVPRSPNFYRRTESGPSLLLDGVRHLLRSY